MIPVERFDRATKGIAAFAVALDRLDQQRRQHCAEFADTARCIVRRHDVEMPAELECARLILVHQQLDDLERRAITVIAGFSAVLEAMNDD